MQAPLNNRIQPIIDLPGLVAFESVARHLNFSRAASEFSVSPTAISKTIKQLEQQMGVRLFNRTTRSVRLTEAGLQLMETLAPALETIRNSVLHIAETSSQPAGLLRINSLHVAYAMLIEPHLQGFLEQYPKIVVEISVDNAISDIVESGFDAGIRLGRLLQNDMVAVPLGSPQQFVVVGAPDYFSRHGMPHTPQDLLQLNCIRHRLFNRSSFLDWRFDIDGQETRIEVKGNLIVDEMRSTVAAARNGSGLAYAFKQYAQESLANGSLALALAGYSPVSEAFYIYYPSRTQLPGKLRAFIDYFQGGNR
ncbi:LysR family transcriptional regulator [Pseudomonas sp. NA-150]|uniref:LysR family transcriptional regulator n=1 Tax=Pseudomonas sp. NA-150 TaxID=3367525 RepID=UPI0037CC274D